MQPLHYRDIIKGIGRVLLCTSCCAIEEVKIHCTLYIYNMINNKHLFSKLHYCGFLEFMISHYVYLDEVSGARQ